MELRPYQTQAVMAVENTLSTCHSTLICLATGCGKTIVFSNIAKNEVQRGGRVLILAHRGELLNQAIDKLYKATSIRAGLEKADSTTLTESWDEFPHTVVVGSVQTLSREKRLKNFRMDDFSMVIIDECHHAMSSTYRTVIDYFKSAKILGVTATPDRGDMQSLAEVFETISFEYSIVQAIRDGFLVPIAVQTVPLKIDLTNVQKQAGDYQVAGIGSALDPYLERICKEIAVRCKERKTIVFTPLIATSLKMVELFKAVGVENVREVNGNSDDREEIIKWFATAPKGSVLVNSMLLTEGFDEPSVDAIVVLRATKVRSLYVQMVGRGTRLSEGKKNLLVLDFLWLTQSHDLCRPASLISDNAEVVEKITQKQLANEEVTIDDKALDEANNETVIERENMLAERLKKQRNKKASLIDPLQYAQKIQSVDLMNTLPTTLDENDKPTLQQLEKLEQLGFACPLSATAADALIKECENRNGEGLATAKQVRLLSAKGFKNVERWSAVAAKKMIARLAMNGWHRMPAGINPETYVP